MTLPIQYACGGCGSPLIIPITAAWPSRCPNCGGTTWVTPPPIAKTTAPGSVTVLDTPRIMS